MKFEPVHGREWSFYAGLDINGNKISRIIYRCNFCNKFIGHAQILNCANLNKYYCPHCKQDISGKYKGF